MPRPRSRNIAVLGLLLVAPLAGCQSTPPSPYLRVVAPDGRVYYAHQDRLLRSESGGFLTFRDLVTREMVKLKNGSYVARECPQGEVELRQREYLDDPGRVPQIDPEMAEDH